MSIHIALHHAPRGRYDRPISLGPRFSRIGHTPDTVRVAPPAPSPDHPVPLDLRRA